MAVTHTACLQLLYQPDAKSAQLLDSCRNRAGVLHGCCAHLVFCSAAHKLWGLLPGTKMLRGLPPVRPRQACLTAECHAGVQVPGVEGFFTHKDVPGGNDIGAVLHDEACFAVDEVTCVGHPIGIVVADTEQHARMASLLVSVEYEELPAIISIEDAIEAGSFIDVSMGGLYHF